MSNTPIITMVFPANLEKVWPLAAELLQPAVDKFGTHGIEDVRKAIMCGNAQLWIRWNAGRVEAALVSEFKNFPKGLWLNVWLFGTHPDFAADEQEFERHMIEYAKANGCMGMMHTGRQGWGRRHAHLTGKMRTQTIYLLDLE